VQDVFVRDRQLGTTELVSVGNRGQQGNEHSGVARISGNGHVVCFLTLASTIAGPRVRPSVARVVVRDLGRERTRLVAPRSSNCALSRTGRLVAFESKARLVRRDQDRTTDVYVRDMRSGRFHLISGGGPDKFRGGSDEPALSRSGRFVAFTTRNARVPSDTNRVADVYVRDLQTGRLIRASIATGGEQGKRPSVRPSISGDGRFVTFTTYNGFEPIDGEGQDAYVRDLQKRTTRLVSVSTTGEAGSSYSSWISADGTSVAFASGTDSVVPEDTNMLIDVFIRRGIR
jgi:Tol biopolymer transport system component